MFSSGLLLRRNFSIWKNVNMAPSDQIFGINEAFKKDEDPRKVNLSVVGYRNAEGKPHILQCVKKATQILQERNLDHEYPPLVGLPSFVDAAVKLAYGSNSKLIQEKRIAALQSLSGTGALALSVAFFKKFLPKDTTIYMPNPTCPNHKNICKNSFMKFQQYTYFDPIIMGVNFNEMMADIEKAPQGSVILLHACGHNPTGADLKLDQWKQLKDLMTIKRHIPLFDMGHQGLVSGNFDKDAFSVRLFAESGQPVVLAQSFSSNLGLYGHRIGCLSFVCQDSNEAEKVYSETEIIARGSLGLSAIAGARIADTVLNTPELNNLWHSEVKTMTKRLTEMRYLLVNTLKNLGNPHNWEHIIDQKGLFAFTDLTKEMIAKLATDYHIYMLKDGQISLAGLNIKNIEYVAYALDAVTRDAKVDQNELSDLVLLGSMH